MKRFYPRKVSNHGNNKSISIPSEVIMLLKDKGIDIDFKSEVMLVFDDVANTLEFIWRENGE